MPQNHTLGVHTTHHTGNHKRISSPSFLPYTHTHDTHLTPHHKKRETWGRGRFQWLNGTDVRRFKDIGQEQAEQALLLGLRAEVRRDFVTTMPGGPEETSAHMCLPWGQLWWRPLESGLQGWGWVAWTQKWEPEWLPQLPTATCPGPIFYRVWVVFPRYYASHQPAVSNADRATTVMADSFFQRHTLLPLSPESRPNTTEVCAFYSPSQLPVD